MTAVTEAIEAIKTGSAQGENGQFDLGSAEQQDAARIAEMYVNNFNLLHNNELNKMEDLTTAAVLQGLLDVQVRDYTMGLVTNDNKQTMLDALSYLVTQAPEPKYVDGPASIAAAIEWEQENKEKAYAFLDMAHVDYPLAKLLKRVFNAGWPADSFKEMRNELHASVTEGIFGEDN